MDKFKVSDDGKTRSFATGAVRESGQLKGRFDLLSPVAQMRLAKWTQQGAQKYTDRNWEKGMPWSVFIDCALRHINAYLAIKMMQREGKQESIPYTPLNLDEDHLAAAAWNLCALMQMEYAHPELDDLGASPAEVETDKDKERSPFFSSIWPVSTSRIGDGSVTASKIPPKHSEYLKEWFRKALETDK